jgi:hypothetical protein
MISQQELTELKPIVEQFVTTKTPAELFSVWNPVPERPYEIKQFTFPKNAIIYTKIRRVGTTTDDSKANLIQTIIEKRDSTYWEGGKQRKRQTKRHTKRKRQTKRKR